MQCEIEAESFYIKIYKSESIIVSINKYITLILLLFVTSIAFSQNASQDTCTNNVNTDTLRINKCYKSIEVHFRFDKYNLDLDYMGNSKSLEDFSLQIDTIGISNIDSIVVMSQSSPEGVYEHNLMLSRNRANTIRKHLLEKHPELDSILHVYPDGESWLQLREYVLKDTLMKQSTIDKVISIIDADINIGTKKWRMEQLPIYKYLLRTYYPKIRNSTIFIIYYREILPIIPILPKPVEDTVPDTVRVVQDSIIEEDWKRKVYGKTNVIGLGMGISNIAFEVDITKHTSLTLPIYYSAWNYFKSTIKFRTFAIQPELRLWKSENKEGFYAGAHFGLAYYNFAFNGEYRYQDYNGKTPAIGGGLSIGYVVPISDNNRWRIEFSLGAGVYALHYDKFYNTPNTSEGMMIESCKKTYWGIDQAAISVSYILNKKKEGDKE